MVLTHTDPTAHAEVTAIREVRLDITALLNEVSLITEDDVNRLIVPTDGSLLGCVDQSHPELKEASNVP